MAIIRTTRRGLLGGGAAIGLGATVPAAARAQPAGPARGEPLRIGLMTDISGPFAGAASQPLSWGSEMAVEMFNERGGVGGRPSQAITAGSQSRTETAINEAERLLGQERLEVVAGIYSSAHAVPLSGRFEQARTMMWITSAIAPAVLKDRNLQYAFRPTAHSDQYAQASIAILKEHSQAKFGIAPERLRLTVIYEDGPCGTGVSSGLEAQAKAIAMPIVLEAYGATAADTCTAVVSDQATPSAAMRRSISSRTNTPLTRMPAAEVSPGATVWSR